MFKWKKNNNKPSSSKTYEKIVISDYDCYIVNMNNLFLCGYVKVPKDSIYFGLDYDYLNIGNTMVSIDSEWTYSGSNIPCCEEAGIGWFFGFDCAQLNDMMYIREKLSSHRDREFVVDCLRKAVRMIKINSTLV